MRFFEASSSPTSGANAEVVGTSVEHEYPAPHPAEQLVAGLDQAAEVMLSSPDGLTRAIGEKLRCKATIKREVDDMLDGADDVTRRQEFKKLGIFVVREQNARFSIESTESGFSIQEGDAYLELHLPPVPKDLRSRSEVERSLKLVADYVKAHEIEARYLLGITYEKLGNVAKTFGFRMFSVNPSILPSDTVHAVARVYEEAGFLGDIGYPAVVFMGSAELLQRADVESEQGYDEAQRTPSCRRLGAIVMERSAMRRA